MSRKEQAQSEASRGYVIVHGLDGPCTGARVFQSFQGMRCGKNASAFRYRKGTRMKASEPTKTRHRRRFPSSLSCGAAGTEMVLPHRLSARWLRNTQVVLRASNFGSENSPCGTMHGSTPIKTGPHPFRIHSPWIFTVQHLRGFSYFYFSGNPPTLSPIVCRGSCSCLFSFRIPFSNG